MTPIWQVSVAIVCTAIGWTMLRTLARARLRPGWAVLFDAAVPSGALLVLISLTARPVVCGITILAWLAGYTYADGVKRRILGEPIVFFDIYQTADVIFRHPQVDIMESVTWRTPVVGLAGGVLLLTIFLIEPPLWHWTPWPGVTLLILLGLGSLAATRPLLPRTAAIFARLGATGDASADAARVGPFAMQFVHVVLARAERRQRRAAMAALASPAIRRAKSRTGSPVMLIQSESFFDARRLSPEVPSDLLANFDRCRANGEQWGRLKVPSIGGNTMRTEFAILTGLTEEAVGFDRFNPYQAFARQPVRSIAWQLRREGYRTICIHPFDPRFYRRDIVMEHLGFDAFLSQEAFAKRAPEEGYIPDSEVVGLALDLLRDEGPNLFIFAITMQNHGPYSAQRRFGDATTGIPALAGDPTLASFMDGLRESDRVLGTLYEAFEARGDNGLIALYGDHIPSFPETFSKLGFSDRRSDYVITRAAAGAGRRVDLAAHELYPAIMSALGGGSSARGERQLSAAAPALRAY